MDSSRDKNFMAYVFEKKFLQRKWTFDVHIENSNLKLCIVQNY